MAAADPLGWLAGGALLLLEPPLLLHAEAPRVTAASRPAAANARLYMRILHETRILELGIELQ
jgi:hypothetical protein